MHRLGGAGAALREVSKPLGAVKPSYGGDPTSRLRYQSRASTRVQSVFHLRMMRALDPNLRLFPVRELTSNGFPLIKQGRHLQAFCLPLLGMANLEHQLVDSRLRVAPQHFRTTAGG